MAGATAACETAAARGIGGEPRPGWPTSCRSPSSSRASELRGRRGVMSGRGWRRRDALQSNGHGAPMNAFAPVTHPRRGAGLPRIYNAWRPWCGQSTSAARRRRAGGCPASARPGPHRTRAGIMLIGVKTAPVSLTGRGSEPRLGCVARWTPLVYSNQAEQSDARLAGRRDGDDGAHLSCG